MRRRTKVVLKLWFNRVLIFVLLALIVWANVIRLQDNDFSNYEKAVDYGRIKDDEELIKPIISAIFYEGRKERKGYISSYFSHSENYKKKNVKIVVVPKKITAYSLAVVEKLYEEIEKYNQVNNIALVYSDGSDVVLHKKMLNRVMKAHNITEIAVSEENPANEAQLNRYLREKNGLVVFLADLDRGLNKDDSDFLVGEAVYFAQKYSYQLNVFDMIDTQLAKALDKGYETLYPLAMVKDEPLLQKQKYNLERYKRHYWHILSGYFELNLLQLMNHNEVIMPTRNEENYRLYDRGRLLLKAFDENYLEIFEQMEFAENEGVFVSLLNIARSLVDSGKAGTAKYYKVYLLTDLEYLRIAPDTMLMSYLDADDGIYAEYKGKHAFLVADDRPDNPEDLAMAVREKAGILQDIPEQKINYYKFKTVEMQYGD